MVKILSICAVILCFAAPRVTYAGEADYDLYLMHGNPSVELPDALDSYTVTRKAEKGRFFYGNNGSALVWIILPAGEYPVETGQVKVLAVDSYDDVRGNGQAKQIYNEVFGKGPSADVKAFNTFMGWEMGQ